MPNDGYQYHRQRFEPDGTVTRLGSNDREEWKVITKEVNQRLDGKPAIREGDRNKRY